MHPPFHTLIHFPPASGEVEETLRHAPRLGPERNSTCFLPNRCRISPCPSITTCAQATSSRSLHGALAAAAERGPQDFADLLQVPGVGARTVRSLALVAEVLHGTPCRFTDPARFSLAHGGKDRHPFPVPTKVMDHTIGVLKCAVRNAKLGREEELAALRRLDAQARRLESMATGLTVDEYIAEERRQSHAYGGRSIFGLEPPPSDVALDEAAQRKARA